MRRKLLVLVLVTLMLLSGCGNIKKPQEPAEEPLQKEPVQSETYSADTVKTNNDKEVNKTKDNVPAKPVPDEGKDNEKQDADENITNRTSPPQNSSGSKEVEKPIGWGVVRNGEHKTPEISKSTKELIDRYGAIFTGDESSRVVYLTFDEGYENGYTPAILDILKDRDVKAAFFVTGSYVKQHPDYVKRMIDEGHIVGNHTMTHPSLPTITDENIKQEIDGVDTLLMNGLGIKTKYLRPPKGEYTERTLKVTKEMGYTTVFWSLAFRDWLPLPGGPQESYETVMNNLHPGAVILLHAESKDDTEALPRIIDSIREEGYEFKTLDDIN